MVRVRRIAIDPDVIAITPQLDLPLRRLVARLAQALQFAEHEGIPVAPVRSDVIHHVPRWATPRYVKRTTKQIETGTKKRRAVRTKEGNLSE